MTSCRRGDGGMVVGVLVLVVVLVPFVLVLVLVLVVVVVVADAAHFKKLKYIFQWT